MDLLKAKQKNGTNNDLLEERTYNSIHRPLTAKDAAGQTTSYTYNTQGQLLTVTTPPRVGITENRTMTYVYDSNGYLESATPPAAGATSSLTYDSYGRIRTITDPENYTIILDYDALDRPTRKTYPDGSYEEIIYSRLDPEKHRDRLGRWTHSFHDALRRVVSTRDPLGATVSQQWCTCGSLEEVVDPNGSRTFWERDIQGRVTNETRADNTVWEYTYEVTTSRLKKLKDPKNQETEYSYFLDDKIQQVTYVNAVITTPNVSYTYDSAYGRPTTLTDGTGTTTYTYHPVTATPPLGAGRLSSVDGPYANDVVSYGYDELGRIVSRTMNGVATTWSYDTLGRVRALTDPLGSFPHDYVVTSARLASVSYPNGQVTSYAYHPNSGDKRLQEIHHRASVSGATLSKLNYAYDAAGNITQWTQQEGASAAKVYDLTYDAANQLVSGVYRTTDASPTILKRYAYAYDGAGNRTVEQIDDTPVLSAYDNMNRLTSQVPGGVMRFAGSLNEAATVTVQSLPATVTASNKFERGAQVSSGTNQVVVKAKDYAGNERTNTYEVTVSGASRSFSYDANGNLIADGTKTYEWDAANRLVRVLDNATEVVRYAYDGRNRRSQKIAGGVTRTFVYDGDAVLEERPSSGSTVRYVYGEGIDKPLAKVESGAATYYLADHLGSILQTTNASAAVTLTRQYDPWGKLLQGSTTAGYAFTGREWDPEAALYYYRARYYDPSVGRFVSEDPLRFVDGVNPYRYARNNPLTWSDPTGLLSNNESCKIGCLMIITTFILFGCVEAGVFAVPCVIIALILLDVCYKRCDKYCPKV